MGPAMNHEKQEKVFQLFIKEVSLPIDEIY